MQGMPRGRRVRAFWSFLHKSAGTQTKIDVTDEVVCEQELDRQQLSLQEQKAPDILFSCQTSPQAKTSIFLKTNNPPNHISNMPRDGSGAGDNAIEAGHNIVHGDAGGVSL